MSNNFFRLISFFILTGGLLFSSSSQAFNKTGHQTIASLSYRLLDDNGKQFLDEILGPNARQEWVSSANWPAEQSLQEGSEWRIPLHRVWFGENDTRFEADQHCPFNSCSVAAILEARYVLEKTEFSSQQRRQAIKYLVHYIADVHQPTNCGLLSDRGGRDILLKTSNLTKVTLHWIWEHGLIQLNEKNWSQLSSSIRFNLDSSLIAEWQTETSPSAWAWECHQIAKTVAYPLAEPGTWGMTYYKKAWPIYEEQIMKAASRVASTINALAVLAGK